MDADSPAQKMYQDARDTLKMYASELTKYQTEVSAASEKVTPYMAVTPDDYSELVEAHTNYVAGVQHFENK